MTVSKIAELLGSIPGAGDIAKSVNAKLEGLKADGGNLDRVRQSAQTRRTERVEIFERAQSNISNAIQTVNAPVNVNVTVPPGTPASLANRVGKAAGAAVVPSRRATQAALTSKAR